MIMKIQKAFKHDKDIVDVIDKKEREEDHNDDLVFKEDTLKKLTRQMATMEAASEGNKLTGEDELQL